MIRARIAAVLAFAALLASCGSAPPHKPEAPKQEPVAPPVVEPRVITFAAVGDVMMGTDFPDNILPDDDGVSFLGGVAPILSAADVAFGNLEGVLMDGGDAVKQCRRTSKSKKNPTEPPAAASPAQSPEKNDASSPAPGTAPVAAAGGDVAPSTTAPASADHPSEPTSSTSEATSPDATNTSPGTSATTTDTTDRTPAETAPDSNSTPATATSASADETPPAAAPGATQAANAATTSTTADSSTPPPSSTTTPPAESASSTAATAPTATPPATNVTQPATAGSCYVFRSPTRYATYLRDAGFDVMSLANNHAQDFGDPGRDSSMRALDDVGIHHSGRDGDVAEWVTQGRKFALVAFAPNVGSHQLNDLERAKQIVTHLAAHHDIVIVSFHGGSEGEGASILPFTHEIYQGEDRGDVVQFAHTVIDAGADLVIGHGPHVLRAVELYKDRLIAYSLGNFATYFGISVNGIRGTSGILTTRIDQAGRFIDARLDSTVQIRPAGPSLDPEHRALMQLRDLTITAFPNSTITIEDDGRIIRRQ